MKTIWTPSYQSIIANETDDYLVKTGTKKTAKVTGSYASKLWVLICARTKNIKKWEDFI
jgi:hypothetical protein